MSSRSFPRLLVVLIACILAASLPFVLRKPVKIDQSTPSVIEHKYITIRMQDEEVNKETTRTSGAVTWNQGGAGVDQAVVCKVLVRSRTHRNPLLVFLLLGAL